jgi:ankyrin repeat protein
MSTLHDAIISGTTDHDYLMRVFLSNTENVRKKDDDGNYPLYLACRYLPSGDFTLSLLKEYPEAINQTGWETLFDNPLHMACWSNRPDLVSLILEQNPSLLNSMGCHQKTALDIACGSGFLDIVDVLLKYPHLEINKTSGNTYRRTVLHNANWKIARKLLHFNGINVDVMDVHGKTPFECYLMNLHGNSIKRTKNSRHYGIIKLYLKKFSWVINKKKQDGQTLLHTIIFWGNKDIFKEVLPYASNIINEGDNNGVTPLHCACIQNQNEMLAMLLKNKMVDINKQSNYGATALHYACYYHFDKIVKKLLAAPNIIKDLLDADNEPPLQQVFKLYDDENILEEEKVLFFRNALKMFELMIDNGGEVYTRNISGVTVIDEAMVLFLTRGQDLGIALHRAAHVDINASWKHEAFHIMHQIVEMLQNSDGKRKKVYNYLRDVWIY